jgi:hypothetical protein
MAKIFFLLPLGSMSMALKLFKMKIVGFVYCKNLSVGERK